MGSLSLLISDKDYLFFMSRVYVPRMNKKDAKKAFMSAGLFTEREFEREWAKMKTGQKR
jgi:hypothetical protein